MYSILRLSNNKLEPIRTSDRKLAQAIANSLAIKENELFFVQRVG